MAITNNKYLRDENGEIFSPITSAESVIVGGGATLSEYFEKIYPVGRIIFSTTDTNPASYFGFGTWTLWGSGRVPVGVDSSDTDFQTVEKTGGSKTHTHTQGATGAYSGTSGAWNGTSGSHTLTVSEIPAHSHTVYGRAKTGGGDYRLTNYDGAQNGSPRYYIKRFIIRTCYKYRWRERSYSLNSITYP